MPAISTGESCIQSVGCEKSIAATTGLGVVTMAATVNPVQPSECQNNDRRGERSLGHSPHPARGR